MYEKMDTRTVLGKFSILYKGKKNQDSPGTLIKLLILHRFHYDTLKAPTRNSLKVEDKTEERGEKDLESTIL